ncbi:MAG: AarF/UbiB family protein [Acidobacteriota bacterium]
MTRGGHGNDGVRLSGGRLLPLVGRCLQVLAVAVRWRLALLIDASPVARRLGHRPVPSARRLRRALESLGGGFVKLGQLLSMQRELLSEATCRELWKLLDRVDPLPFEEIEQVASAELGRSLAQEFDAVERRPLASASIAQVHVARRAGRRWALKIQRPRAVADFGRDLAVMAALAAVIRRLGLRSAGWLADSFEEFADWTARELDFRWEARFMTEISRRRGAGADGARIPELDAARSGRRLLVAELLDGPTLVDHLRHPDRGWSVAGFDPERFARRLVEAFLGDVFRHGIFHADLHPGNLVILPGARVGTVDFGIVGRLSRFGRRHLVAMTLAYTRGDVEAMLDHFERLARCDSAAAMARYRDGVRRLADGWFQRRAGRVEFLQRFPQVMLEMMQLSRTTKVWPQREVVLYFRSVLAADGLVARFAPGFDLEGAIRAFAGRLTSEQALVDWLAPERWLLRLGDALEGGSGAPRRRAGA